MAATYGLRCSLFWAACLAVIGMLLPLDHAHAIPSFARQTGYACNACHTVYPQLTPLGREFKLRGYVDGTQSVIKQVSAWLQGSFTHTSADQPGPAAPHFGDNDNFAFDQASVFFGGKIVDKVGAFLQGTYDGVGKQWAWDNMDIRFANQATIGGKPLDYGLSINNNPTVQDLWNTTPAWGYPFDSSPLAPGPGAATLIEGGLGQISVGASIYARWDRSFYAEVGLYRTLGGGTLSSLGIDPAGVSKSDGVAPYWRLTYERQSGAHSYSIGTFGLHAALFPAGDQSAGSDKFTDVGVDSQYQWSGARDNVTGRLSLIREDQNLKASFALGNASRRTKRLLSLNASVTYLYDQTIGLTLGATHLWGQPDALLYGTNDGSPNTTALTLQLDWLPLNKVPWGLYPWFNPKLTAQYIHFVRLDGSTSNIDGSGRTASENDALFLLATLTL